MEKVGIDMWIKQSEEYSSGISKAPQKHLEAMWAFVIRRAAKKNIAISKLSSKLVN